MTERVDLYSSAACLAALELANAHVLPSSTDDASPIGGIEHAEVTTFGRDADVAGLRLCMDVDDVCILQARRARRTYAA